MLERQCEDECGAKPTEGSHAAKSPMIMNSDLVNMMVDEQAREADDETENERNAKVKVIPVAGTIRADDRRTVVFFPPFHPVFHEIHASVDERRALISRAAKWRSR